MTKRVLTITIALFVIILWLLINYYLVPKISPPIQNTPATSPVASSSNALCHIQGVLPDPSCTPGSVDPNITETNITETICHSGYTATVRPPVSYTNKLKLEQIKDYGFKGSPRDYEEDHLIPLEIGGSPSDPRNLWPEPGASPNSKDKVENFLHEAVCSGRISLEDAQKRITIDWTTAGSGL